ncbi:glucosaminidase domain-containing protein [Bacteroidales bacterium OttesenSCG-928-I21]|nr:glucosaminidase domain-containing protein [Bacteroidales bacterium OttesenSCG-928-I21]
MKTKLLICLFLFQCFATHSQISHEEYIAKFSSIAIKEMNRSGVPASITLAQGLLESGSGNSYLATSGNNHFGIKCGSEWSGEKIFSDDDAKNECFRKYNSAEESYKDHSDFLVNSLRYTALFELEITDYKGWAKGLKKAGYATSPIYAEKLIELIERYKLYEYDQIKYVPVENNIVAQIVENKTKTKKVAKSMPAPDNFHISLNNYEIRQNNKTAYIVLKEGANIKKISRKLDIMLWQIRNYNDLDKNSVIKSGDVIYLKHKRNKAEKGFETHQIKRGETMWSISQLYGIKLKKLYDKNNIEYGIEPPAGTTLSLRKKR